MKEKEKLSEKEDINRGKISEQEKEDHEEEVDKCPGCNKNVKRKGVICEMCKTWWHYSCQKTTEEEIKKTYKERERSLNVVDVQKKEKEPEKKTEMKKAR